MVVVGGPPWDGFCVGGPCEVVVGVSSDGGPVVGGPPGGCAVEDCTVVELSEGVVDVERFGGSDVVVAVGGPPGGGVVVVGVPVVGGPPPRPFPGGWLVELFSAGGGEPSPGSETAVSWGAGAAPTGVNVLVTARRAKVTANTVCGRLGIDRG